MALFNGIDKESAGRVSGEGFYYLMGDIARLHSAVLAYARDFMIDKGFYLLHTAVYDSLQCRHGRYELFGNGRNDV